MVVYLCMKSNYMSYCFGLCVALFIIISPVLGHLPAGRVWLKIGLRWRHFQDVPTSIICIFQSQYKKPEIGKSPGISAQTELQCVHRDDL